MFRLRRQVLDFGVVGIINTVIDFAVLNILSVFLGVPRIPSNIVSTSLAMIFSFFANKRVVFNSKSKNYTRQVALFFVVTVAGLYGLQTAVIYLFADVSDTPGDLVYSIVEALSLDGVFSRDFAITNAAKLVATALTMVWNFILYKRVVFVDSPAEKN